MRRVSVIGAGSWGTTVASLAATKADTSLWARRGELAEKINETRSNPEYLPDHRLPDRLSATGDIERAVSGADVLIMAVPSHGFRQVFAAVSSFLEPAVPVLSLTKGIEQETLARMTEVVTEISRPSTTGVLTGPNLAAEIVAGQPTATVVAMSDAAVARDIQSLFMGPTFRVYTNDDVIGCELGGAIKNVMAIASGMSDGLGFGDNTRATVLTRALAELTRLGTALGGRHETFAGLAGMGDLIATCSSTKSRNYQVGHRLAFGQTTEEIIADMKMVAEGVKTTKSVLGLADRAGVEMPIVAHVGLVLDGRMKPREAVMSLMTRVAKAESR